MKNKKRHIKLPLAIFACVLMACPVSGEPDSLSLSTAAEQVAALPDDTVKVNVLDSLFATYASDNLDVAVDFARQGLRLSEKLSFHMGRAWCLYDLGKYHYMQGRYEQAMNFWLRSLKARERYGTDKDVAKALNTLGAVLLKIGQLEKAKIYFERSASICGKIGDYSGLQAALSNLGAIAKLEKRWDQALGYYEKSLEIVERYDLSPKHHIVVLCNMGGIYISKEQYDLAMETLERAETRALNNSTTTILPGIYLRMANAYYYMDDEGKAIEYYKKCMELAQKNGMKEKYATACYNVSEIYADEKNFSQAYHYLKIYEGVNDSIISEEGNKQVVQMEAKYQNAQKEKRIAEQKLSLERQRSTLQKQRATILASVCGGFMLLLIAFLLLRQNRIRKKANIKLNEAYELISQQNKDITDSITYASRIQHAILPPERVWKDHLDDSFVLFKPKDIVSGDFYWMESVEQDVQQAAVDDKNTSPSDYQPLDPITAQSSRVLFAAVDCTGHGVPGAFMSIIGFNGLNKAVREHGLRSPADILMHLNKSVRESVSKYKDDVDVKDGMDISLCALNKANGKEQAYLEYAGAINPLYIISENGDTLPEETVLLSNDTHTLFQVKANKYIIGDELDVPFQNHRIPLSKGDQVYIFSDGYADQFGGPKGKKFKYSRFRKLLLNICTLPIERQCKALDDEIESWKGELEQLDDILVIGARV